MNFNSQICTTREQSERLLALGLKKETADMFYESYGNGEHDVYSRYMLTDDDIKKGQGHCGRATFIPAWSLPRLIEMMPIDVVPEGGIDNNFILMKSFPNGYSIEYDGFSYRHRVNIYDTFIATIELLIKEGYFNKEYLL